ncbi:MAG: hypothetical protein K0U68_08090 [Gammaproteobacteria bacterium]|nr:hypothetical protein [Gammaproteobacteria bacterium]
MDIVESEKISVSSDDVRRLVNRGQNQYWCQLNKALIEQVAEQFALWPDVSTREVESGREMIGLIAEHILRFLLYEIGQSQTRLEKLRTRYGNYSNRYTKAVSDQERQRLILDYARDLGANDQHIKGDRKAFKRWFGHDAVSDRYQRRSLETERYISFVLDAAGRIAALLLKTDGKTVGYQQLWERIKIEPVIKPLLVHRGDRRVVSSAFHCLTQALKSMPVGLQTQCISESSLRFIYHASLSSKRSVWIQCEALELLQYASPESLLPVFRKRLVKPQPDDDLFVRRKVVDIMARLINAESRLKDLIRHVIADSCPSVRQKLPDVLNRTDLPIIEQYYPQLLFKDGVEQVRASALLGLSGLMQRSDCYAKALSYLLESLYQETHTFVLRVALKVCRDSLPDRIDKPEFVRQLLPALNHLHLKAESLSVRRWASQTREYLLCHSNPGISDRIESLRQFVEAIPPGRSRKIPADLKFDDDLQLGRLLSVLAQEDYGFDVEKSLLGTFLTRGHAFGFRIWRLLHEFRHPSPDKRQAFQHTRGRLFWGTLRVPSAILSELAETKVPGEPLYFDTEDGWRGYLPLVDDVLSSLNNGKQPTWFYHSEGITCLKPPQNWFKRWLASWRISYYFADYARMRNWREDSQDSPHVFLKALTDLGIKVSFQGHDAFEKPATVDSAVLRFFPAALPMPVINSESWHSFKDYFVSVYENSLYELSVFLGAAIAYFLGRHVYLYRKLKQSRSRLPLVLGGWGTRGKSGTERIKAALMNALGYSIVSKTTGCEAMFLHAHPFGELREMFLFRPYDKATIWEQHNLVCLSDQLNTEVFLWECMGLTPSYIEILQNQWMTDDIATITNTYPDHEDLQGPAGVNIPEVMTRFIPKNSTLVTSEEQMLPILRAAAREKNTEFRAVTWLECGLLADDILQRYPYDEHPFNIALVMAMGRELGVEDDFTVKEMADRVVADIGVLKTFPCAPLRSRRLEFINGMSANERFGCLGNWTRMGLDKVDPEHEPDTWITIVVNNRADRIARSRVFASIIVKDISFDRCVLIGNNLTGMLGYIKEAWAEWIESLSLGEQSSQAAELLSTMAKRFRIASTEDILSNQLQAMISAQNPELDCAELLALMHDADALENRLAQLEVSHYDEIMTCFRQGQSQYQDFTRIQDQLKQSGGSSGALQNEIAELLWGWFEQKLVVVDDYYASGDQVIKHICDATPPGFYNRILGMQNIKGTGLDFVYRWQAWENCQKACQQLLSKAVSESRQGLNTLSSIQEFGYLAKETVQNTVHQVRDSAMAQNDQYQSELEMISSNLEHSILKLDNATSSQGQTQSRFAKISEAIEAFLDAGDAVKRRKRADQIYQDLVDERISHDRAVLELQTLNKRQKGGWFKLFA